MTHVVPVTAYSKLVRAPHRLTHCNLLFRDLLWDINVRPMNFDEDGLADTLVVSVVINFMRHGAKSYADTHITLEILDETGEHTVFHKESSRETPEKQTLGSFILCVRRELEASSCVSARYDKFIVRCTLEKKQQQSRKRRCLLGSLCKSNAVFEPPPLVAMAGSHTLTVGSVSGLRAALRNGECIYSTHFAVGGSTWYLKFCPGLLRSGVLFLVCASNGDEMTPTTGEFTFEFEGLVNFESHKTRHTFDCDKYDFYYHRKYTETSPMQDDRLVVRCCLAVVMPEEAPTAVPTCSTESVLTPLLSAMHG